jgi:hypothetical protein
MESTNPRGGDTEYLVNLRSSDPGDLAAIKDDVAVSPTTYTLIPGTSHSQVTITKVDVGNKVPAGY